jgi:hypothetical protein
MEDFDRVGRSFEFSGKRYIGSQPDTERKRAELREAHRVTGDPVSAILCHPKSYRAADAAAVWQHLLSPRLIGADGQ